MNYKIVDKESFAVVGKQRRLSLVDGENFIQGAKFWDDCIKDGSYEWLSSKTGKLGLLGVSMDFSNNEFNYLIGVEGIKDTLPKGYVSATIPAATWAVFESVGALPEALVDIIRRVYSEWFPATGYQQDCSTPGLEVYPEGDKHSPDYRCEYWVPVKK